eukprot:6616673-Pyramimonas_sp.AAC.1
MACLTLLTPRALPWPTFPPSSISNTKCAHIGEARPLEWTAYLVAFTRWPHGNLLGSSTH